jgi:hypothetical protein
MYFGIVVYGVAPLYRLTAFDGTTLLEQTAGTSFTLNAWNHVAWVRSGTTFTAYLNGASVYSTTNSKNITGTTGFQVGHSPNYTPYYWAGNISNFRIVKGTAVYTSAFTPPTAPLTAITNTSLLITGTGQGMYDNATFVDQGPNALTMSAGTTAVYSGLSPFGNTYPGSIYCPTINGYVTGLTADDLSASDWTFEAWVNISTFTAPGTGSGNIIISKCLPSIVANFGELTFAATTAGTVVYIRPTTGAGQTPYAATSAITANTWTHVAAVYTNSNTTLKLYKNGTLTDTFTSVTNGGGATTTRYGVGQYGNGYAPYAFSGYISNARVAKTAVYTANFTPSTTPLTAITNTSLLVRGDTGAFYDLSNVGNPESGTGSATVTTQVKKFGNESGSFSGVTTYISAPNATGFQFGSGDFTVEMWLNTADTDFNLCGLVTASTGNWMMVVVASQFYWQTTYSVTNLFNVSAASILNSAWHHIAISRSGTSLRVFFDGVQQGSSPYSDSTNYNGTGALRIGSGANGDLNGYLDDIRITKGVARYTANFTPPTATFPTGP